MTEQPSAKIPRQRAAPDEECRLGKLEETLARGERVGDSLGTVACLVCFGIFDIDVDRGVPSIKLRTSIPCMLGRLASHEIAASDTQTK